MPDPNLAPRDARVNGSVYSWNSCGFFLAAFPYKGITKLDYKQSRKRVYAPNAQQDGVPQAITSGVYRVDSLSWTMLRDSAQAFMADQTPSGGGSYGDSTFDIVFQLYEPLNGMLPSTTLISGVAIEEVSDTQEFAEDGSYLVTEFTAKALYIVQNVGGVNLQLWSLVRSLL